MKNKNGLSWREEAVFRFLLEATDGVVTHEVYTNVNMSKATALKSLAVLEAKGLISHEMVGPSKTWHITRKCEKCGRLLIPKVIYLCEDCNVNLYMLLDAINSMEAKEDRWDKMYEALKNINSYLFLREKGFIDEMGLTEKGADLNQKMKNIYEMC